MMLTLYWYDMFELESNCKNTECILITVLEILTEMNEQFDIYTIWCTSLFRASYKSALMSFLMKTLTLSQ